MTRIYLCFDCGGDPCVLRCPEDGDFLPMTCPFYGPAPDDDETVRPAWKEAVPVKESKPSPIIEVP